ncbi:hypothetical protein O977_23415 [Mycobacterium avium subsp. paratuberculosis 10-5975]|nr:hypothetical protein O977_23415 [Mycobacterium avium subsp. paratuberculosis 10-5975]
MHPREGRPGGRPQPGACRAVERVQLEHPPVHRERVAALQREPHRRPGLVQGEAQRHGRRVVRVAAQHPQQRRPRVVAVGLDGYGMLIDIGQSFHIEGMY